MNWPDRIKRLRGNLSQKEFAVRLNVTQATVSDWETGKRVPTGAAVRLIEMLEDLTPTPDEQD